MLSAYSKNKTKLISPNMLTAYLKEEEDKTGKQPSIEARMGIETTAPTKTTIGTNEPTTTGATDTTDVSDIYEQRKKTLEEAYNTNKNTVEESKNRQLQSASVLYDKLLKYLPVQQRANGLQGLAINGSDYINASNKYANTISSIESDAAQQQSSLLNEYNTNRNAIDVEKQSKIEADEEKAKTEIENNQLSAYNAAASVLQNWASTGKSAQDALNMINGLNVSDTQKNNLLMYYNSMINTPSQQEYDKTIEFETALENGEAQVGNNYVSGAVNTDSSAFQKALSKLSSVPTTGTQITYKENGNNITAVYDSNTDAWYVVDTVKTTTESAKDAAQYAVKGNVAQYLQQQKEESGVPQNYTEMDSAGTRIWNNHFKNPKDGNTYEIEGIKAYYKNGKWYYVK